MATQLQILASAVDYGESLQLQYPDDVEQSALGSFAMAAGYSSTLPGHVIANYTLSLGNSVYLSKSAVNADFTIDFSFRTLSYGSGNNIIIGGRAAGGASHLSVVCGHSYGVGWWVGTLNSAGTPTRVVAGSTSLANGTYVCQLVVSGDSVKLYVGGSLTVETTQTAVTDAGLIYIRLGQSTINTGTNNFNAGAGIIDITVTADDIDVSEPAMRWVGSAGIGGGRGTGSSATNSTG